MDVNFFWVVIETLTFLGFVAAGVVYLRISKTKGTVSALQDSVNASEKTINAQREYIECDREEKAKLKEDLNMAFGKITVLENRVDQLSNEKIGLQYLIVTALTHYFEKNPKEAEKIGHKVFNNK